MVKICDKYLMEIPSRFHNQRRGFRYIQTSSNANNQLHNDVKHPQIQGMSRMAFINNWAITKQSFYLQSNVTGLNSDKRWTTRSINKLLNRLIEVATPRIFDLNQRLFNYAINNLVVPRINKILSMYSVIMPSTKLGGGSKKDDTVYLRELDAATIVKYLKTNPVSYPDEMRVLNMLFDERFFDNKVRRKRDFWSFLSRSYFLCLSTRWQSNFIL